MKKRLLILLLPLLFVSCGEDFTSLSPKSDRNAQNYYKTQSDFEVAIKGVYDALQNDGTFGVNYVLLMEMRADNGANGGGASGLAATLEQLDTFQEISTADELDNAWFSSYEGIARANMILSRIDDVDFNDGGIKDQIKGEALFIRSIFYYNLAVIFGNVPARYEEAKSPSIEINQVPASDIYAKIADDLTEAENMLPASSSNGRITSGAAAALLGRVYLQAGDKASAKAPLERVVNSGVYELVDDYEDLWGEGNEGNKESIFEIQFIAGGIGEGSSYTDMYTPNGAAGGNVGGGVAPQDVTSDIENAFSASAGDERFNATLDTVGQGPGNYWVKKFDSSPANPFDAPNNWVEIRYAEVLLNLAEVLGESTQAYDYINMVRNRAGLSDIDSSTPGSFEEKLLAERRLEFAFENKRWPDLLRFGKAKEVMSTHLGINQSDVTLLYPIPLGAIDVAPDDMTQNPEHN